MNKHCQGDPGLLDYMGDDAERWAAEFCKAARDRGHRIDEGWMVIWFANAIEHSFMVRTLRAYESACPKPSMFTPRPD